MDKKEIKSSYRYSDISSKGIITDHLMNNQDFYTNTRMSAIKLALKKGREFSEK
jgi:hypothetical protein